MMHIHHSAPSVLARALLSVAALAFPHPALAQSDAPRSETGQRAEIARLVQQAAETLGATAARSSPPAVVQAVGGDRFELTLDEAVARALERNLDIRLERLSPRTFDFSIQALTASYRPQLTSGFSTGNRITIPNSQLASQAGTFETGTRQWSTGVAQDLPWGGARYAVDFGNQRVASSNEFTSRNPSYNSSVSLSFVQPLLRGFTTDGTRAQLGVSRVNQAISEVQLESTMINTVSNVRNAYWDYVYATQAVDVSRESLALAEKLLEDNRERVRIGTMAPIDVVQTEAEIATRRQIFVQDEVGSRTAELALKELIVGGTDDELWRATLVPTDRPAVRQDAIDVEAAVNQALEARTDLRQARQRLTGNDVSLRQLGDQTLPALDLSVTYGLSGLGGPEVIRRGLGGEVSGILPGGYTQALRSIGNLDAPNWAVGFNLRYPMGTSAARAELARARLVQQQTETQLRRLELRVATEVTSAALRVGSNLERMEAASTARGLAERRLEAEVSRFAVGLTTNFFVVQAQRDLREAQIAELRTLLDYEKSLVEYERLQRTTLSLAGITVIAAREF